MVTRTYSIDNGEILLFLLNTQVKTAVDVLPRNITVPPNIVVVLTWMYQALSFQPSAKLRHHYICVQEIIQLDCGIAIACINHFR